jgi:hypothetical protein
VLLTCKPQPPEMLHKGEGCRLQAPCVDVTGWSPNTFENATSSEATPERLKCTGPGSLSEAERAWGPQKLSLP